ncbi:unnamed protein product [Penicillium manginii]
MDSLSFGGRNSGNQVGVNYGTIHLHPAYDTSTNSAHRFRIPLDLTAVPVIESFLGREAELDRLWQYLQPKNAQSRKVAILHGLGGIGKTQLAIRFARDHKDDFTAIFWLNGKDRSTLLQSLSLVLPRLPGQSQENKVIDDEKLEQRAKHVLKWLAKYGNSRWLLILDNIDQYSSVNSGIGDKYDIRAFFPSADHGSIIITSRLSGLTELGKSFPICKLDRAEAIQLLLQNSGLSAITTADLEDSPDTLALASRLDGLPLAIIIAAAFMRQTGTSISEYLQYYEDSWSDLQSQSRTGLQYQQGNMLQTWMISYREIQKRDLNAAELLLLLACFDNRDIWYQLLKGADNSSNIPTWLKNTISSGLVFKTSVKTLITFSLLETKLLEGSYAIHPVVQDWCHHITYTDKKVNSIQLYELALISVGYTIPSGRLREAKEMYQRALAGREKALGPDHTSTLSTVNNLGVLYSNQGRLKEAEEMYQRALAGYEKALGPDHTSTLSTVSNLGILYSDQGRLKEAEEMYQRALAGKEKALGPDHTSTLGTMNSLGSLYSDQGKFKEAKEMYQRALAGKEKALGPDHTSTLGTVNNLGVLYSDQGRLKEAEEMYQRALAGYEKALGLDHTSTLDTVNNLGVLYSNKGRLKEAEEMYQRALAGYEKALGPDHTSTLGTVSNLGILYKNQGRLKEAKEMYQRELPNSQEAESPNASKGRRVIEKIKRWIK